MILVEGIGERVREARKARGLTQQKLADQAGVSISLVRNLEQGVSSDPLISTVEALSRVLQVDLLHTGNGGPA